MRPSGFRVQGCVDVRRRVFHAGDDLFCNAFGAAPTTYLLHRHRPVPLLQQQPVLATIYTSMHASHDVLHPRAAYPSLNPMGNCKPTCHVAIWLRQIPVSNRLDGGFSSCRTYSRCTRIRVAAMMGTMCTRFQSFMTRHD